MSEFIEIKNLSKSYTDKKVISKFNAKIPLNRVTVIMGASGSGKTTLLRILAGLEEKTSGEILNLPQKISYVFQEDRLCADFNAINNIRFVTGKSKSDGEIKEALSEIGIFDVKMPIKNMSGGMKRRVAVLRALSAPFDLLILDEALKGLDDGIKDTVIDFILEKAKGKTVICVTHDTEEAQKFGGNIINIERAKQDE